MNSGSLVCRGLCALIVVVSLAARPAWAADDASVKGTVVDLLGARVASATVKLLRDGRRVAETTSNAQGEFTFQAVAEGRYQIEVTAAGFDRRLTDAMFVGASAQMVADVRLQIGPLEQQVVVTAAANELPASQIGAAVTVIDHETLENLAKPDVLEALRLVPGSQVVQTGQRGGPTSFFVRGGASNFNKVLIDGVSSNDIGGAFDFSNISTTGVESVEVLRESNSVLYGSDALTGVVSITTQRGRSRIPEFTYGIDGGNLSTFKQAASLGGAVERFDYFSAYSHFQTDNSVPNNAFKNDTYAGRFGVAVGNHTDVSGTIRHVDTRYGSPNGIDLNGGVADDSFQTNALTFASVTAQSQITERWQSTLRVAWTDQQYHSVNPAPTGEPFDPFGSGANYLGNEVTLRGANGYTATGRAILDYGGTYPSVYDASTSRQTYYGQASYHVLGDFTLSGGARFEHEDGFTDNNGSRSVTDRNNGGTFVEGRGTLSDRHHITAGIGYEHNAIFGNAATPRVSIASYVRRPSPTAMVGDTKVVFNAGNGIKAPSISQELSSLYSFVQAAPSPAANVGPIGPERSRIIDVGVEQGLWAGHVRLRASYFHNQFDDLIEFVSKNILPELGVPPDAAAATAFGAYVNSQSNRAQGVETSGDAMIGKIVRLAGSYTYLDAVVTKSLSDGVLSPAFNPAFPTVPIGQYSPLVGAQPFRRPKNSGSLLITVMKGPGQVTLAGYFAGKQDDSTFLSDAFYGNSLLLPNHDLDAAYQKVDLSGSCQIHPRLRWFASIENILDQHYYAAFGFPALPRTFRTGISVTLGGDR